MECSLLYLLHLLEWTSLLRREARVSGFNDLAQLLAALFLGFLKLVLVVYILNFGIVSVLVYFLDAVALRNAGNCGFLVFLFRKGRSQTTLQGARLGDGRVEVDHLSPVGCCA